MNQRPKTNPKRAFTCSPPACRGRARQRGSSRRPACACPIRGWQGTTVDDDDDDLLELEASFAALSQTDADATRTTTTTTSHTLVAAPRRSNHILVLLHSLSATILIGKREATRRKHRSFHTSSRKPGCSPSNLLDQPSLNVWQDRHRFLQLHAFLFSRSFRSSSFLTSMFVVVVGRRRRQLQSRPCIGWLAL